MTKAIKISEENYKWLVKIVGSLEAEKGERVTIDEAINHLKQKNRSILDLAGTWAMSEKETKEMFKDLKKGWGKWSSRYA